jgi:tetratricopeptide (TPR) repeat protein
VATIRREPMPPGPIADLFDRLHELHLAAGLPSMREIAAGIGRGVISSSTIHNMFRGSRVPRWGFLELVVEELHGDPAEFRALWQAARVAEDAVGTEGDSVLEVGPPRQESAESLSRPPRRIWSPEIPPRNPDFIGRTAELETLRANLTVQRGIQHPAIQVVSGLGGIGKTEIATQFVHLYRDRYEIIWWIRAEHHDRVREALVRLGRRLDLRQAVTGGSRERAILAVLHSMESGLLPSWLLVYDNAIQPLDLQRYLPRCLPEGHIIITSRLKNWPGYIDADSIEVSPFNEEEAVNFLRHRVPVLGAKGRLREDVDTRRTHEASRLAAALGHLPIAVEHAAAYLAETGQSVDEYLIRFGNDAHQLLSEQPSDFPASVSATWAVSTTLLTSDAEHLFNLCAFFSPEPIAADLLLQNAHAITEPPGLREVLSSSHRFRSASSQLHRLSLARVDGARDLIQVHRVVQAVTKGRLRENLDTFRAYRAAADTLLAESNPESPDRGGDDAIYDLSLPHLESDHSFFNTDNPALRRLIVDQVRRLHLRGGHVEAMRFGQDALQVWQERLGRDDLHVLSLAVEVAIAMKQDGHTAGASQLILETLRLLRERYGDEHEVALLCANAYGADLRTRGQFIEALELDRDLLPKFERVFGSDHERTFNVLNNIGADYRRLGRFWEALEYDRRTYEGRRRILGDGNPRTLHSHDAVARDLRGIGRYQESLDTARKVVRAFAAAGGRENLDWLNARKAFAVALRKAGHHWDSLQESEEVVQRYHDYLGPDHTYTLRAATNLINDRRAVGDLVRAGELGREVLDRCREAGFPFDISYAALANLASVLRAAARPEEARRYDLQARDGLISTYGDLHPFTLAASVNYAADLAACGELAEAIRIGQDTVAKCHSSLGENHPDTLMATANLAIDKAASGEQAEADGMLADVLRRYEETLTAEHPEARAAEQRTRLTAEIEPY